MGGRGGGVGLWWFLNVVGLMRGLGLWYEMDPM